MLFTRINIYKHQNPRTVTVTIKTGFQPPQHTITNNPKTFLCMTNNVLPYFRLSQVYCRLYSKPYPHICKSNMANFLLIQPIPDCRDKFVFQTLTLNDIQ
jgi:hypothetical protein